ncbi:hypothetical protein DITRI_Ditri13aG0134800 [Diplodiscus trichospermus]
MFRSSLFLFALCLLTGRASSLPTPCHDSERSALLQFKKSLLINESASAEPSAYPKVQQWKSDGKGNCDCCAWDGVECNNETGHVIGLDLRSSFLYGSIDSTSSLFHLLHLRRLDLSDNDFNHSKIPSAISNLSRLSYLDLSFSVFSGQIPAQVFKLSRLVTLNLSLNELELRSPELRNLAEKLKNLKELDLNEVNISSAATKNLGNLSSLISLSMEDCSLHGELPATIFQLPNLQILDLGNNPYLTGKFPEFNRSSLIEVLILANTSFSGKVPESMGNLKFLSYFDIESCYFSGLLPSSIGELTKLEHMSLLGNYFSGEIPSSLVNLTELTFLSLSYNSFSPGTLSCVGGKQTKLKTLDLGQANLYGEIPSFLGNLTQLTGLYLAENQFSGQIPSCLENLKQLTVFTFYANQITGPIPFWLGNLTLLTDVDLSENKLQGQIPQSIFNLVNLTTLYLNSNELNDTLKFESFLNLSNLINLQLSYNYLSVDTNITINVTVPKFRTLTLGNCNLPEFPDFLHEQNELENLDLSRNKIHGQIPKWVWEKSKESLFCLTLFGNFLTGFDHPILPLNNLKHLNLGSNNLQGSIPIPPSSIFYYSVSNNSLTGDFSPLLCNLSSLAFLDLSNNNFNGMLPQCLANLSESLLVLSLQNNSFVGSIPQLCMKGSILRMIDFSENQFQGQLPRSLANCGMIETLNLGSNKINDTFPFWLGKLPELKILILRCNQFYGTIEEQSFEFPKLQIIDLSFNGFRGKLLSQQFQNLIAMKVFDAANSSYLQATGDFVTQSESWSTYFPYSMMITSKGMEQDYEKIQEYLVAIDFSSNSFEGCISENIGNLKALSLLNFSNNVLSCHIPPSMGILSNLESLDLSHNNLSGEIPSELLQLTFLEFFNVSQNHLTGQIPQGKQFATFENNSFGSNQGLCGKPLSKACASFQVSLPPLSSQDDQDQEPLLEFDWKIILIGFGIGLVIGLAIGNLYTPNRNN